MKRLIINADDFGFTRDVNAGIVRAHTSGVLTSATLMANGEAFEDAVRLARETPTLDIGCHLVLVQGRSLLTGDVLPKGPRQLLWTLAQGGLDIYGELRLQIEKICAAGVRPTHLDTHKHTHLLPRIFRTVVRLAYEFAIPYVRLPLDSTVRLAGCPPTFVEGFYRKVARQRGVLLTDHFRGFRLTGSLTEETFAAALADLPGGLTEFMCHPGLLGPDLAKAETRLKESRVLELKALTSPRIRKLIVESGVRLSPFCKTELVP
ncbi:MAG: ChbG/HpnK family deacetylase [Acidobacteriota bacterium]|nr:ChbG/HpnK family deacetylase [Acidobacteriota bacterium]